MREFELQRTRLPLASVIVPNRLPTGSAQMTCFGAPCVVGPYELLFYNGNGYGRTDRLVWLRRRPDAPWLPPRQRATR